MDFNSIIDNFQAEMLKNGITPPTIIIADSNIHRFHIHGDKPGTKNGWYVLFEDIISAGAFGNWKSGITLKWCSKNPKSLSAQDYIEFKKRIAEAKQQRDTTQALEQKKAAILANSLYSRAIAAKNNHRYLSTKRIFQFCAKQSGSSLMLPIIDVNQNIWSLQYIKNCGAKRFLKNGKNKGNFIPIQGVISDQYPCLICEGFATGATLAKYYPNHTVVAACNAGNLKAVATNIKSKHPSIRIVICADDDPIGLKKAKEAALATNSPIMKPKWPNGCNTDLVTDFNDLDNLGIQGVCHVK